MAVEQIQTHQWPSGTFVWLAGVKPRMDALARSLSISVVEWEEDGLGLARGALIKLSTGRVILVYELIHAIEHLGSEGPTIKVDAGEASDLGFSALMAEVKNELLLSEDQITGIPDSLDTWRSEAVEAVACVERVRRRKESHSS